MTEKVEVVITIPKHYLEHPQDYSCLAECVRRGVPLPKGHGRLIDADKLKTHFIGTEQGTDLEVYLEPTIINASTIIESEV